MTYIVRLTLRCCPALAQIKSTSPAFLTLLKLTESTLRSHASHKGNWRWRIACLSQLCYCVPRTAWTTMREVVWTRETRARTPPSTRHNGQPVTGFRHGVRTKLAALTPAQRTHNSRARSQEAELAGHPASHLSGRAVSCASCAQHS